MREKQEKLFGKKEFFTMNEVEAVDTEKDAFNFNTQNPLFEESMKRDRSKSSKLDERILRSVSIRTSPAVEIEFPVGSNDSILVRGNRSVTANPLYRSSEITNDDL